MRYAKIMNNDSVDGDGLCVSLWVQGCPIHCDGCHNESTWDFSGGQEFTDDTIDEIRRMIDSFGVHRNFSVLGGEPLCKENIADVAKTIRIIRGDFPNIKIYVWTGYSYDYLKEDLYFIDILSNIDYLIDGPFVLENRNIMLKFRGSPNQRIIDVKETLKNGDIKTL